MSIRNFASTLRPLLLGPCLAPLLVACGTDTTQPSPISSSPERDAILGAASTASADGVDVSLKADPWYNVMPVNDDPRLIVTAKVISSTATMPANVHLEHVFVVRRDEVWDLPCSEKPGSYPNQIECTIRNGPSWSTWGPSDQVDVVARVTLGNGRIAYIAQRKVDIDVVQ